jgi:hypothetical protein
MRRPFRNHARGGEPSQRPELAPTVCAIGAQDD